MMEGIAECAPIHWNLLPEWTKGSLVLKQFSQSWKKWTVVCPQIFKNKKKNPFFFQNVVKTLVRTVRCKHTLGALLIHTDWKLARQKGQLCVPGAGEDGAICLFVKRRLSFYEKWEMWAVWLSQLLLPQRRDAFLLCPSAAQILVPLWYLCLACSSQPLIYIPYEFRRFRGSASRSCRTEAFQNTLPIWKPRAALGIFLCADHMKSQVSRSIYMGYIPYI